MDEICQQAIKIFNGKLVHIYKPSDYIHPAAVDVIDDLVADDPRWDNNATLTNYRVRKKIALERKNKPLRTKKDPLQSYLKRMEIEARKRKKYASTRS